MADKAKDRVIASSHDLSIVDIILLFIGEILFYFFYSQIVAVLSQTTQSDAASHLSTAILMQTLFIWLILVLNRRRAVGIYSWIVVFLIVTVPFVLLSDFSNLSGEGLLFINSMIMGTGGMILGVYAVYHTIVHGFAWMLKKNRPVFTKRGLFNYVSLFIFLLSFTTVASHLIQILF